MLRKECHTFCNGCLLLGLHKELGVATAPIAYDFMPWNHLCMVPSEFWPGNSNISELFLLEDLNFLRIALSAAASPGNAALEMLRGLLSQTVTWHYTHGSLSCTNMQTAVIPGRTEIIEVVPSGIGSCLCLSRQNVAYPIGSTVNVTRCGGRIQMKHSETNYI